MNNVIKHIKTKVKDYKRRYYINSLLKGTILFLALTITIYIGISSIEYFGNFNSTTRTILFFSTLAFSLYFFARWVIYPAKQLINADNELTDEQAALQIGNFFPEIKDKLLNTIQLSKVSHEEGSLILAGIQQKSDEINPIPFVKAVKIEENKRYFSRYLLLPLVLLFLLFGVYRQVLTVGTSRLIQFDKEFIPPAPYQIKILNNSLKGTYKEDFTIKIETQGTEIPDKLYINIEGKNFLVRKEKKGNFTYTIPRLTESKQFYFDDGRFKSKKYELSLIYNPQIINQKAYVTFPQYLQKKPEVIESSTQIELEEGAIITWNFETQHTSSLRINNEILKSKKNQKTYQFKKKIIKSEEVVVEAINEKDHLSSKTAIDITMIPDLKPTITSNQHLDTLFYQNLLIAGTISDDYGFSNLKLHYTIKNDKDERIKESKVSLSFAPSQIEQNYFHQLNLKDLNLNPNDKLEFYLSVWDNDQVNGFKKTSTQKYIYKIPSKKELEKSVSQNAKNTSDQISKSAELMKQMNDELKKFKDKLKTKKSLNWEDKKDLQKLLNKQKDLQKDIEKLNEEYQKYEERYDQFNKETDRVKEKAEQLQKLMQELMDDEMQELMKELEKLLNENADDRKILDELEKMEIKNENAENELDKSLEMFKQLQFDKKLDEITKDLKELAEKQDKLSQETKNSKKEEEKSLEEQEELNEEFQDLKEKMDDLEKLNEDLDQKHELDKMDSESSDIEKKQSESSEQLKKGNKKNASKSQKDAAEKMKEMAQKMKAMQQNMEMQQMKENMEDLRAILENLIQLSYDQEEVMNGFKTVFQKDPKFVELSQEQLKLQDDSQIIKDSLIALSKRVSQIESFVTRELSDMNRHMDESVKAIKDRKSGRASGSQHKAMTSMNNLALMLSDVLKNMQQQMAQQMPGNQSCNKPGNSGKPSLGNMQQELNKMMQQMKNGELSGRKLSEKLAKMAARQEMIRRALQKAQQESGGGGSEPGDKLMEELMKMMEETEKELINNSITEKTIERQKEIETRLLESEKAEKERDFNNERKAETATQKNRISPPGLEEFLKQKEKEIELLKTIPPDLLPYYKKEVNEYFESIKK